MLVCGPRWRSADKNFPSGDHRGNATEATRLGHDEIGPESRVGSVRLWLGRKPSVEPVMRPRPAGAAMNVCSHERT
jgi:hypothetical protein